MNQYSLTTLKNGLRLITVPMPQVESVTVMVGVGAGGRHETKSVNGLFHFIEHMAFKGTKKRPSSLKIASEVYSVGGIFNASTGQERTYYFIKLASKHQELAFDILADMLFNSLLKTEEIEKEKRVIIEEINMYEDTPIDRIGYIFLRLIYGDNPMGWEILGEKKTIKQIKREDFLAFIDKFYFPGNMAVAVAGRLDESRIKKLAAQYFGNFERKRKKQTKTIKLHQKKARVKVAYKKTDQAHFCLGVPGYWYAHPDRFTIGVLATILGGSMSSRLFLQIREMRGLAYYVRTEADFFTDSGLLATQAGVKLEKIEEAIKICLKEYGKIAASKVKSQELTRAKEILKGGLILSLEDSMNVAGRYLNHILLEEEVRTPQRTMALIDKVTAEDIQRVAKAIFKPEKLNLAIIGPYKDEGRFKKLLR